MAATELASAPVTRIRILGRATRAYKRACIGPENFQGAESYVIEEKELRLFRGEEGGRLIPADWRIGGVTIFGRYNHAPHTLPCIEYVSMPGMATVKDLKRYLAECASTNASAD